MLPEAARFFLETTSIRGVGKIVKTQNVFLSRLWALFVLASTTLLFYSVSKIIVDYLQYDVNIQTYLDIDDATPFPAVSICNNQPFSKNAYRLWADKRVRSPSEFNRQLREKALRMLTNPDFRAAYKSANQSEVQKLRESIQERAYMSMHTSLVMDNSRTYYQNTAANDSIRLGHERNESLVECVIKYSGRQALGTKGCHDPMLTVTQFSDPNFFNCMTIEFNEQSWNEVQSLTLIVWLGPDENYDMRHRQGFLYDVFEQAYGLRVAIHEPKSQPKILEQGIQTEPGKMNEIKYQPVRFVREKTPKKPCISPEETSHVKLRDLYNDYDYDQELCLDSKVQAMVLEKCGCLYIELPRIAIPNSTHPYCGIIDDKMLQRSICIQNLHLRELRKSYEANDCLPKCVDRSFDKEISVTKWRDTQWMIYWIKELCERWDNYFGQLRETPLPPIEEYEKSLDHLQDYLATSNITNVTQLLAKDSFKFDDHYTFLVVKRQSYNTLVKKEKIVLTLNALFSRVGGLCSVYIGLTLAFFMECIELLFKLIFERPSKDRPDDDVSPGTRQPATADTGDNGEQLVLIRSADDVQPLQHLPGKPGEDSHEHHQRLRQTQLQSSDWACQSQTASTV